MMKIKDLPEITVSVAAAFVQECFEFDYYNLTARMQSVLRRPLMILIEFEESGNDLKTHIKLVFRLIAWLIFSLLHCQVMSSISVEKIEVV